MLVSLLHTGDEGGGGKDRDALDTSDRNGTERNGTEEALTLGWEEWRWVGVRLRGGLSRKGMVYHSLSIPIKPIKLSR